MDIVVWLRSLGLEEYSIMADFERLREMGVLSLAKQGPAANGAAPAANGNGDDIDG